MACAPAPIRRFIDDLAARGARLSVAGDKLSVAAPPGVMTREIAAEIQARKTEIMAALLEGEAIPLADRSAPSPLGVVQERMWAHAALEPGSLIYNLPAAWRFEGPFDVAAFQHAFDDFVLRHEALRLRVTTKNGAPAQTFRPPASNLLAFEDLTSFPTREATLAARVEELRRFRFDLEQHDPFIARLYRLSLTEHVFFFMPHHLVWDGWCFDILLKDLRNLYLARLESAPVLPKQDRQYVDYAVWHRARAAAGAFEADIEFWGTTLADPPAPPNLPEDLPRPRLFDGAGDWLGFPISAATLQRAKEIAASARATTFMTFLALWRAFLARITGDEDIIIGAPIQARQYAEVGDVVGCFVNTIFLRQTFDPAKSLSELLRQTREVCLAAYRHQEAPVELLVDRLVAARDPSRTPLSQVMFSHQQVSRRPGDFGAARLSQIHINPHSTPTDLMFAVMEGEDDARAVLHYATSVFSREQAQNILGSFEEFIGDALANPGVSISSLALMSPAELKRLTQDRNGAERAFDLGVRAHEMIARVAEKNPEKTAIIAGQTSMSHAALEARAEELARWLGAQGVRAGDIVGLLLPRNADLVALPLALWRVGAAYLPLDSAYPEERLRFMIEDSGARLVVVAGGLSAPQASGAKVVDLDAATPGASPDRVENALDRAASSRAYVIYTSGSTGKPKGVENSHRALANFLHAMIEAPGLHESDRLLAVTTLAFDISILELFAPLAAGGEVIIASAEEAGDSAALARLIENHAPTIMQATPATWRLLIDSGWSGAPQMTALAGGEALSASLAEALLPRVAALYNMYGPTETTVWSTLKKIDDPNAITIGRPIANTRLHVVDTRDAILPPGIAGELLIAGEGVAIGYLNRPDLTASRFLMEPFRPGARMYRTGDLVRRLQNDEIEHLGRIDAQVKLRGYRIELGEIETALETHPAIARAVAAVRTDAAGEPALVAYHQLNDGEAPTGTELRRHLRRMLPAYMLPQIFIEIGEVPLTGSGKVDRRRLPDPAARRELRGVRVAPRTEMETRIAGVWRDLLAAPDIAIGDNFFELGGNSLQAAQMIARVAAETGRRLAPRAVIFDSLEQLAAALDG
jgi:amino acid adenylation domain-containing protein